MTYKKIFSLLICLAMMAVAALSVNKSIFGYSIQEDEKAKVIVSDTITKMPKGMVIVHTDVLCDATGYAGRVPLDVYISRDGTITDIVPQANHETPRFLKHAEKIFKNWIGNNVHDISAANTDAITGATYTSEALKANVEAAITYYIKESPHGANHNSIPFKLWIALAVTLAACIVPLFVKNKYYNNAQLIANVVVLGFWCGQFLDYTLMLKYLSSGISLPAGLTAIVMLIAAFIYPLFGKKQHYCNHICPLGSAQILLGEVCKHKIHITSKTIRTLGWFRKILWAVLMILLWFDVAAGWMDLELFQAFMVSSAPAGIIIAALVFLALSCFVSRPYCRFVCPTGSLFKRAEGID